MKKKYDRALSLARSFGQPSKDDPLGMYTGVVSCAYPDTGEPDEPESGGKICRRPTSRLTAALSDPGEPTQDADDL